jgi:hypothetical protein
MRRLPHPLLLLLLRLVLLQRLLLQRHQLRAEWRG